MRRSPQTNLLLAEFANSEQQWRYGYDLGRNTGLKSGTLYPILIRLADNGMLETTWETSDTGKPPRHMYRLTPAGQRHARTQLAPADAPPHAVPALEGTAG